MSAPDFATKALPLILQGLPVFPCVPSGDATKQPLTTNGFKDATTDMEQVGKWSLLWPQALVGVPTGKASGIDVIDLDVKVDADGVVVADGFHTLKGLPEGLPPTRVHKTKRGEHHLFKCNGTPLKCTSSAIGPGIDTRGEGGYIIWWPAEGMPTVGDQQSELPGWVKQSAGAAKQQSKGVQQSKDVQPIQDGQRNATLFIMASSLQAKGYTNEGIMAALSAENRLRCNPPLPDAELQKIVAGVVTRYEKGEMDAGGGLPAVEGGEQPAWPDPKPIPDVLLPVPAFDYTMLPDGLVDWVRDSADRMQCPPDYIAVVAMTALGAIVARKRVLRPKKNDTGWVVLPNIWCAIIGRSAMMKSPALKTALKFLRTIAAAEKRKYAKAVKEWKDNQKFADMEAAEMDAEARKMLKNKQRDAAKEMSDKAEAFRREHSEPVEKRYETNDATPEVLHQLYAQNPQGIINIVDELARWINDMFKQGRENSRQFHIESWDGDIPYTMDRIGRGKNMQATMCETVIGGMQPARLHPHVKAANSGTGDDDGLIQRFSMMVWPDSEPFVFVDRAPNIMAENKARGVFESFDSMPIVFDDEGSLKPVVIGFSAAAQSGFIDWYCRNVNECRSGDIAPALASHLLKYSKAIPALAMIIGIANGEREEISTDSWNKAIKWHDYLRAHAERIYDYASSMLDEIARNVLKKITDPDPVKRLGHQAGENIIFSARDAMRKVKALEGSADLAREVLDFMVDLDCLVDVSSKIIGKDVFMVNPKVFNKR